MSLIIMFASMVIGGIAASIAITSYDAGFFLAFGIYATTGTTFIFALIVSMYSGQHMTSDDYF